MNFAAKTGTTRRAGGTSGGGDGRKDGAIAQVLIFRVPTVLSLVLSKRKTLVFTGKTREKMTPTGFEPVLQA